MRVRPRSLADPSLKEGTGDGFVRVVDVREESIGPSAADLGGDAFTTETGWEDLGYQRPAERCRGKPWWKRVLGVMVAEHDSPVILP